MCLSYVFIRTGCIEARRHFVLNMKSERRFETLIFHLKKHIFRYSSVSESDAVQHSHWNVKVKD
jgi:hypothetical protein